MKTADAHNAPLVGKIEVDPTPKMRMMVDRTLAEIKQRDGMGMNEYQRLAEVTVVYKPELKVIYPTIGLCGETGEVAEKVKKWLRDDGGQMTDERRELLKKELGDVMWYLAVLAKDLGLTLDEIARHNIEKLLDRKERGVVHGKGDIR